MPISPNTEAVRTAYRAFTDGDLHQLIGSLAADFVSRQSAAVPWRGTYRGHDVVREMFAKVAERAEATFEPSEFIEGDDRVLVVFLSAPVSCSRLSVPDQQSWSKWQ